jgi:glycine cleavage system protein P-like pyridoxal-binding family
MPVWLYVFGGILLLAAVVSLIARGRRGGEMPHVNMHDAPPVPQGPGGQQKLSGPFGRYEAPNRSDPPTAA